MPMHWIALLPPEAERTAWGWRALQFTPRVAQVDEALLLEVSTSQRLWGGQDRLIPPSVAQQFVNDIAGSQIVTFDDLGHVPHEEDPVRTVEPFKIFLKSPSSRPDGG